MAPRKQVDDKSQPLAAAAVGAGTEPVQAQAEQKKDGVVLVDPAAEAARLEADQQAAANQVNADWLLGQFDVKAKSPAGFWRCQVHFLHSSPTRVFVVEDKAAVPHDHDCEIPCCYLTPEEAKRVHGDPWLVCTEIEVVGA
ncbi:hypothetical protein C2U39_00295 [Aeromonas sp. ASNIH3]|uniref:hypothetical protein n=1 Tax=Aeromonas sp. ASNIH3 TaxID=1636608 RepID=UPI000CD19407|nr:hypothetical protein [Aeromonas sp. ASNIH3]AUV10761.1 hypothetical protein C2U39_00295 [Aeromonas sp. ASNIH3]